MAKIELEAGARSDRIIIHPIAAMMAIVRLHLGVNRVCDAIVFDMVLQSSARRTFASGLRSEGWMYDVGVLLGSTPVEVVGEVVVPASMDSGR